MSRLSWKEVVENNKEPLYQSDNTIHHDPLIGEHMKMEKNGSTVFTVRMENESPEAMATRHEERMAKMNETVMFDGRDIEERSELIMHDPELPGHLTERERSKTGAQHRIEHANDKMDRDEVYTR